MRRIATFFCSPSSINTSRASFMRVRSTRCFPKPLYTRSVTSFTCSCSFSPSCHSSISFSTTGSELPTCMIFCACIVLSIAARSSASMRSFSSCTEFRYHGTFLSTPKRVMLPFSTSSKSKSIIRLASGGFFGLAASSEPIPSDGALSTCIALSSPRRWLSAFTCSCNRAFS